MAEDCPMITRQFAKITKSFLELPKPQVLGQFLKPFRTPPIDQKKGQMNVLQRKLRKVWSKRGMNSIAKVSIANTRRYKNVNTLTVTHQCKSVHMNGSEVILSTPCLCSPLQHSTGNRRCSSTCYTLLLLQTALGRGTPE